MYIHHIYIYHIYIYIIFIYNIYILYHIYVYTSYIYIIYIYNIHFSMELKTYIFRVVGAAMDRITSVFSINHCPITIPPYRRTSTLKPTELIAAAQAQFQIGCVLILLQEMDGRHVHMGISIHGGNPKWI